MARNGGAVQCNVPAPSDHATIATLYQAISRRKVGIAGAVRKHGMLQLTYISTAAASIGQTDVDAILHQSRRNNAARALTGMLLFDGRRFLQHLEGDDAAIDAVYERIRADERHRAIVQLSRRTVDTRVFDGWSMAFERVDGVVAGTSLEEQVAAMVERVDPVVAAHFNGFAAVRSSRLG